MKKICCLAFIVLSINSLYSQVAIEAVEIPGSRYQFVSKNTGIKVNDLTWDAAGSFVNGFAKVSLNQKWNLVDGSGNPVGKTNYESVRNFVNGLAAARQNSNWGFIDEKGITVIPFEYDIVFDFKEAVTAVHKNSKWFLINKQGNIIKPLDVDVFWGFKNGLAKITRKGRNGIINTKGEIISLEPEKPAISKKATSIISRSNSAQNGTCPDNIDFEFGNFTNWSCYTGQVAALNNTNVITVSPSPPTANRHVIIPATNPPAIDPYGLFPINPPDGSGFAVKLGNDINGHEAERISYQINVPANATDVSITYRYAVVFQDPGHQTWEQPRFSAKLLDVQTNTYLPCAAYEYISTSSLPGFTVSPVDDTVKFKNWASVYVNLSRYAGKSLILEFTTADCTRGAHWGYAYIDVGDCNISASVQYSCNPSQAVFTAPPGFQYYNWYSNNFGTLLGSGQTMTMLSPPVPGTTIHVEVIPYNGFGCSDTLEVPYIAGFPYADAGPDKSLCLSNWTSIGTNMIPGNTYSWTPATFLSSTNTALTTANPPVTTTYHVLVTNSTSGCTSEDSVVVNVTAKPTAAFNSGPPQCLTGNSFSFTNGSSISAGTLNYTWTFGDGTSSTQLNPVHSFASAGTYSVKLVVTSNNGCMDSITHPAVTVYADPPVKTNNDLSICRGNTVQLQTTGATTYTWNAAPTLSCTNCSNPVASPLTSASYIVKGTDNLGCYNYDTVNITVFQPISIDVSPDRTICQGEKINLQAAGTATSYIWSPAQSLSSATTPATIASPMTTTQYRVVGYDGHNCFNDTAFVNITVSPTPTITLGPDVTLSTGTVYPLTSVIQNGPIVWWQWTPATDLNCSTCPDPSATIKKDITYHVSIRNSSGCTASDSINIKTFCEGSQVFIPNAFTPDGDGKNDILMVRAKGIESVKSFRIFTRWGELIFEKTNFSPNDPAYGWDGKIKGVNGAAEVYVYTAEVICTNLQTYMFKGNTSILK